MGGSQIERAGAMTGEYNPFTDEDLSNVNECLAAIAKLEDYFRKCTDCQLDVRDQLERLAALRDFFLRWKRNFFPNAV